MRKVRIEKDELLNAESGDKVLCWRHAPPYPCITQCAAFTQVTLQTPGAPPEMAVVCAAIPQALPIGSLGEPSKLVIARPDQTVPIKR